MDDADRAERLQAQRLKDGIEQLKQTPHEEPLCNDQGVRICKDCGISINMMRLAVVPHAVRCMPCQSAHEGGLRR